MIEIKKPPVSNHPEYCIGCRSKDNNDPKPIYFSLSEDSRNPTKVVLCKDCRQELLIKLLLE